MLWKEAYHRQIHTLGSINLKVQKQKKKKPFKYVVRGYIICDEITKSKENNKNKIFYL